MAGVSTVTQKNRLNNLMRDTTHPFHNGAFPVTQYVRLINLLLSSSNDNV